MDIELKNNIYKRIVQIQEKYRAFFLLYGNRDVINAWKNFSYLGY